jgi:hypothetical protein
VGRYTKAYAGTLACVCTGSIVVAVHAHEKASKLTDLNAGADRWQTWASNERRRDARASAQFNAVARKYRSLARQVERSQRRLLREIAATNRLRRRVVTGTPVVTYVNVRKLVPVMTAPAAATASATAGAAAQPGTHAKLRPHTTTKPKTHTGKPKTTGPGSSSGGAPGGTPTPGTGSPGGTTTTTPGTGSPGGGTTAPPPAPGTAPVNTQLPSIAGVPQSSKTISADPGSWTGNPTSFEYTWQRCDASGGSCIVVGSGQSYTCVPTDIDKTMRVSVKAANTAGSAVAVSAASPKTKPS